jgi:hypothetical protein
MLRKFACLLTVAIALSCVARAQAQLPNGAANREATLNYLKQLDTIAQRFVREVDKAKAADDPAELAEVARQAATSILQLPTRGVDREVVECARKTAILLNRLARLADMAAELAPGRSFVEGLLGGLLDGLLGQPLLVPMLLDRKLEIWNQLQRELPRWQRDAEQLAQRWVEVLTRVQRQYNINLD